ncbi:MAG: DUF4124 domain-containing protein [Deltaproteobacteria bacterium]|nr:DUF4124 domain-containing protein [Deltaproteobacteria bacterium]
MAMRFGQWIIVLVLTWVCAPASAEIYRYVDEQGKVLYTDDLSNVHVDQRPKVGEYGEPDYRLAPEEGAERKRQESESPEKVVKEAQEVLIQKDVSAKQGEESTPGQKLEKTGAKLQEEYQNLMKEKEELEKAARRRMSKAARRKLRKDQKL